MNWTRGQLIGRGSSASVSLAKSIPNDDIIVVKSIEYSRSNDLQKEQEIHSCLKCDRIIDYKGYDVTLEDGKLLYNILLEYACGGALVDVIRKQGGGLTDLLVRQYTGEILRGLEYLHSKGMVHCDVKGANILVTNEGVKIGDFGCCKRVDDMSRYDSSVTKICGTPMYMGPEVARGEQQSYPADVWALGCTVLEMATGMSPWPNITQHPVSALYHIGFSGALPEIPAFLTNQAKDFLSKCLKRNPKERWSVAELLKHPFVIDNGPCNGLNSDTPTSILDQGIWEIFQEPNSAQNNVAQEKSTITPSERIKELMMDSSRDEFPNWACDEDWVIVRCNKTSDEPAEQVSISIGPDHYPAQYIKPTMTSVKYIVDVGLCPTIELNFPLVSVELSNCCSGTKCSDFRCKCIILAYQNCEQNFFKQSFACIHRHQFSLESIP